jgi:acetyl-CoA synthetase
MSDQAIDTLSNEVRRFPPSPEFAATANATPEIYDEGFEELWARCARERVSWFTPFEQVLEWELPFARWFTGGTLNVAYNCVDRHVEAGLADRVAYHWEGSPVTCAR